MLWPRDATRPSLAYAVAHARSQCGDDEAGEGDAARQDHMSAHDLTSSATASETLCIKSLSLSPRQGSVMPCPGALIPS